MGKKYVCLLAGIISYGISFSALSAGIWTNGQQKISAIIWRPNYHGFYVEPSTFHDPEGCEGTGANNLYEIKPEVEQDAKTTDRLYAMLMSAMVSNKRIHVWVDGCDINHTNAPNFTGLQINNN